MTMVNYIIFQKTGASKCVRNLVLNVVNEIATTIRKIRYSESGRFQFLLQVICYLQFFISATVTSATIGSGLVIPRDTCGYSIYHNLLLNYHVLYVNRWHIGSLKGHLWESRSPKLYIKYHILQCTLFNAVIHYSDSKAHGANMRPIRVLSAPDGPLIGSKDLVMWVFHLSFC